MLEGINKTQNERIGQHQTLTWLCCLLVLAILPLGRAGAAEVRAADSGTSVPKATTASAMLVVPSQLALQSDDALLSDVRQALTRRLGEGHVSLEVLGADRFPRDTMLRRWRETMAHRHADLDYVLLMHDAAVRAYRHLRVSSRSPEKATVVAYGVHDGALRQWLSAQGIAHIGRDVYAERSLRWALEARRPQQGPLALWYAQSERRDALVASARRMSWPRLSDAWLALDSPDEDALTRFSARRRQRGEPRQAFLSAPVTQENLASVKALAEQGWHFWCYQRAWLEHGCLGGVFAAPEHMADMLIDALFTPDSGLMLEGSLPIATPPSALYRAREQLKASARDGVNWLDVPETVVAQRQWTRWAFTLATAALIVAGAAIWLACRRERKQRLKRQALRNDRVTGLPGRLRIERRLQRFMDDDHAISLYYLAFDTLHHLRTQFGVEYADLAAQGIAERLRDTCGGVCYPARLSDDVFVVLASGAQQPLTMAARYQEILHAPIEVYGVPYRLEPRIGIALSPEHGKTPVALLHAAQDAADQVLASAGAEPQLFKLDLLKTAERRRVLAEALAEALEQDTPFFELYLQPQYRLANRQLMGAETLIRWQHATFGTLSPGEFIPVAEASHQIVPLDEKVFDAMLDWLARQALPHTQRLVWAINLSIRHFDDHRFGDWLLARCEHYGVPPQCIELEVTEHVATQDLSQVREIMRSLRLQGFGLVLDDFGTGYTSLRFLKELPFTKVKLDKVYVDAIAEDERSQLLVKGIADLARGLGLTVVAEGIETQEQMDVLRGLGCPMGQGYLLGRPRPVDSFLWRLSQHQDVPSTHAAHMR
ncbi:EAL domain-containing protein (putative c-di-GMP-specific phosphodiesterase class I) [Chromohalobacter marismortui]|uniref:EAL domain-containing protein (Putative c-di-GMP-specific phosphodiesterase class I) n=1 Tax=Chromohalobacter marismortui TaxID=42055 RepID=A0A4R7NVK2_9GAMM|nr:MULTISPECIES: bifunctional diguanylate cyclase/phosphodiesterase [Chromohalobacter]MCI0510308.1 bifunctional diguanylate cyclase/phosphodiesterase [Chromohalobacter sp.]MCI0594003.1 bifunctional diguanylate cyclase/phosphodiesterase [Chromohalobacter sp.]TDU25117.1 EAL domain-containing protein (putative c-di-GMP-specific phosphodiesterase class I) [Chromohalobacter marismortui]